LAPTCLKVAKDNEQQDDRKRGGRHEQEQGGRDAARVRRIFTDYRDVVRAQRVGQVAVRSIGNLYDLLLVTHELNRRRRLPDVNFFDGLWLVIDPVEQLTVSGRRKVGLALVVLVSKQENEGDGDHPEQHLQKLGDQTNSFGTSPRPQSAAYFLAVPVFFARESGLQFSDVRQISKAFLEI
jgi:hypothetical protein